ncbi:class I SAM-dependent methyltransferase [Lachnospiraceae bacterium 46-15]
MQLSKRLLEVSGLVSCGSRLADVGTDHGYIPIWLTEQGVIRSAVAMDINRGPLLRAQENIRLHGLEEKIETRLSNGVAELRPGEADSVVIAGMGGSLMVKILEEGKEVLGTVKELVLQPQSDVCKVRRFLQGNGYRIDAERMVLEDGKFYPMMYAVHGKMEPLSDIEAMYGPCLLRGRDACLRLCIERERQTLRRVKEGLEENGTEKARERQAEIRDRLRQIEEALRAVQ